MGAECPGGAGPGGSGGGGGEEQAGPEDPGRPGYRGNQAAPLPLLLRGGRGPGQPGAYCRRLGWGSFGGRPCGVSRALLCSVHQLCLPPMRKKPALADGGSPEGDLLQDHWLVEDMFTFENVGFTKDVGNIKFLVCADCEIGPIGWHCLDDKNSFYVALERVSHE